MRYCSGLVLLGLLVGCTNTNSHTVNKPVVPDHQTTSSGATDANASTSATNTRINQRDQHDAAKTPLDQSNKEIDIRRTADIRQKIVNHKDMSINARNVKIITEAGHVTLRGPVNSQAEKDLIAQMAKEVAGDGNVDNQLEVAADKSKTDTSPPDASKADVTTPDVNKTDTSK